MLFFLYKSVSSKTFSSWKEAAQTVNLVHHQLCFPSLHLCSPQPQVQVYLCSPSCSSPPAITSTLVSPILQPHQTAVTPPCPSPLPLFTTNGDFVFPPLAPPVPYAAPLLPAQPPPEPAVAPGSPATQLGMDGSSAAPTAPREKKRGNPPAPLVPPGGCQGKRAGNSPGVAGTAARGRACPSSPAGVSEKGVPPFPLPRSDSPPPHRSGSPTAPSLFDITNGRVSSRGWGEALPRRQHPRSSSLRFLPPLRPKLSPPGPLRGGARRGSCAGH